MFLFKQYVLVEILQGETDMLLPMFKQRGLPVHPNVIRPKEPRQKQQVEEPKLNVSDFVKTNKILSPAPPSKPGMGRNLIERLQRNVIYS